VGPLEHPTFDDLVIFGHHVLDRDLEVGKSLPISHSYISGPLLTGLLAPQLRVGLLVIDAISGEELVEHRRVAVLPELTQDALDDCLVLLERHGGTSCIGLVNTKCAESPGGQLGGRRSFVAKRGVAEESRGPV
jgi:hypothetical protein